MAYDDHLSLGPVPAEEEAASVGTKDYEHRCAIECAAYRNMLERLHPVPDGVPARYRRRRFPHDFGGYYEIVVEFDSTSEEATDFAYSVENNLPIHWDDEARHAVPTVLPTTPSGLPAAGMSSALNTTPQPAA